MEKISTGTLFALYLETLEICSAKTKNLSDEDIEYNIFEEFIVGVTSFLATSSLERLLDNGLIDEQVYSDSKLLRIYTMDLDGGIEWNVSSFRDAKSWDKIINLSDKIKNQIHQIWSDNEIDEICQG